MSYRRDLKLLRRARRQAKRQLRQLADLELAGLTAITLHVHGQQLTVNLTSPTGAPFTDALRELLNARRRTLREEARQVLLDWQTSERAAPARPANPLPARPAPCH